MHDCRLGKAPEQRVRRELAATRGAQETLAAARFFVVLVFAQFVRELHAVAWRVFSFYRFPTCRRASTPRRSRRGSLYASVRALRGAEHAHVRAERFGVERPAPAMLERALAELLHEDTKRTPRAEALSHADSASRLCGSMPAPRSTEDA